jgi:sugar/nucleoside kinase (ribokinase family)
MPFSPVLNYIYSILKNQMSDSFRQNGKHPLIIAGAGCCLVDRIFPDVDFSLPAFQKYGSRRKGDGGLHPGRLVFSEPFEAFSGRDLRGAVAEITKDRAAPILNVGGPSIVALIHAAQLLQGSPAEVQFYGARGDDAAGEFLQNRLEQTPVKLQHFKIVPGSTPSTIVLSDPHHQEGQGERAFINEIGAAWKMKAEDLEQGFFDADVVVFGGTALVPRLHDQLTVLLQKARAAGCITVVNTVYDFRNESVNPGKRWPLGSDDESYQYIDLLITDREEALHLSGKQDLFAAGNFFKAMGVSAFLITSGTEHTLAFSDGRLFKPQSVRSYPVSSELVNDLKDFMGGDTTGCGDNFVGGVLASLAWQMLKEDHLPDLGECLAWGTVSGGYCCFHVGGTFLEMEPGEKLELIRPYYDRYNHQING